MSNVIQLKMVVVKEFLYPGWHRRRRDNRRLEPLHGWRLVLHRVLWGFDRLVYVDRSGPSITVWDKEFQPLSQLVPYVHS